MASAVGVPSDSDVIQRGGKTAEDSKSAPAASSTSSCSKSVPHPSTRYGGDSGRQSGDSWPYALRLGLGILMTINFIVFWAIPIFGMGASWHHALKPVLQPIYNWMERHPKLRDFASKYIYQRPIHADYFAQSILVLLSWVLPFGYCVIQQRLNGTLSWWQVYFYYCMWVGIRGGTLGGAYSLAHREGHNPNFYKPAIANSVGNLFENLLGPFFGNVPYNFSTSHIYLHHFLQAGSQDSFYQFDMDRTSWKDFMVFLHRITLHCLGISSVLIMYRRGLGEQWKKLARGMVSYLIVYPLAIYLLTGSWSFVFFMYVQPFIGMTFFLSFMNFAFHAFVDYDDEGKPIGCVNSTCIVDGNDDYFGEDDHMAHHYATHVYWRDLPEYRKTKVEEFKKYNAMVFHTVSIVELAILILFKQWERLADFYVQFNDEPAKEGRLSEEELIKQGSVDLTGTTTPSVWVNTGKLSRAEVIAMLKSRAIRREPIDV